MSAKNLDKYERFRSKTVAFRVSPEEWRQISMVVEASGMTKQDYLVSKVLDRTVTVKGGAKVYRGICVYLDEIRKELSRIEGGEDVHEELKNSIDFITNLISRLRE